MQYPAQVVMNEQGQRLMKEDKKPSPMKDFTDKLFDLCREYQQEIPPNKISEVLRDYADRLDG